MSYPTTAQSSGRSEPTTPGPFGSRRASEPLANPRERFGGARSLSAQSERNGNNVLHQRGPPLDLDAGLYGSTGFLAEREFRMPQTSAHGASASSSFWATPQSGQVARGPAKQRSFTIQRLSQPHLPPLSPGLSEPPTPPRGREQSAMQEHAQQLREECLHTLAVLDSGEYGELTNDRSNFGNSQEMGAGTTQRATPAEDYNSSGSGNTEIDEGGRSDHGARDDSRRRATNGDVGLALFPAPKA